MAPKPLPMRPAPCVDLIPAFQPDTLRAGLGPGAAWSAARETGIGRIAAPAPPRYRQLIFVTLAPLAAIVQSELREKLDSPGLVLSFAGLHGADLATRGRALKQLVDAGVSLAEQALGRGGCKAGARAPRRGAPRERPAAHHAARRRDAARRRTPRPRDRRAHATHPDH